MIRRSLVGQNTAEAIGAASVGGGRGGQGTVAVQLHGPSDQIAFAAVMDHIQIGVVPDAAVEGGAAGGPAHTDGDTGRIDLGRIVPTHCTGVGDGGTHGQRGVDLHPEPQFRDGPGRQVAVGG